MFCFVIVTLYVSKITNSITKLFFLNFRPVERYTGDLYSLRPALIDGCDLRDCAPNHQLVISSGQITNGNTLGCQEKGEIARDNR